LAVAMAIQSAPQCRLSWRPWRLFLVSLRREFGDPVPDFGVFV
jgi:hypothetical protein